MKVKELIRKLELENPESDVILQKDAEGNGYSPLSDIDGNCVYVAECTWSGEVWSLEWSADDACKSLEEWEKFKQDNPRYVVLAPVN